MTQTTDTSRAFEAIRLREIDVPNRIWMSPMCQYSAGPDGVPTDWHLVHYASRAVGGAGLVMVESTAVSAGQRTTSADLGLYTQEQVAGHRRLTDLIREHGAVPAVQLQCAGRKSSHMRPWEQRGQQSPVGVADGGWIPVAPSAIPFSDLTTPREATEADLDELEEAFARAARLADQAGYDVAEVHAAHGYLLHQFLSPLANTRTDRYGGSLENRMRFPLRAIAAARAAWPESKPLLVRVTATDWVDGGITVDEAEVFSKELADLGVDMLDVTSGALVHDGPRMTEPLYNVPFARPLRAASGLPVAAVGLITEPEQTESVIAHSADAVLIGRALLRDPYWPLRARDTAPTVSWPAQYHRAL
ncbi:NADH:flavin oxidoreductase/NADH oxidase [Streptomyces sp. NPDC004542]|uniref:NADH:flavin oxidoreductase/NADH oxidase n=1 Tax=Streptomyces sp. NPDC004542 TaxID=3154281 RepID=UPI0033BEA5F1